MTLAPPPALFLRNVRPLGAAAVDVLVQGERIARSEEHTSELQSH